MNVFHWLAVLYAVGVMVSLVTSSARRAFLGATKASTGVALLRACLWPLGVLAWIVEALVALPVILGTSFGQGMREGLLANAAKKEPARPTKIPVFPYPAREKSPSAKSPEWPTGQSAKNTDATAAKTSPSDDTAKPTAQSFPSATTAAPSPDTNSASG